MLTIAIGAAKGGVGKTTLASALAIAAILLSAGLRVGIIDLDPQGSLTQWWNVRAQPQPLLIQRGARPLWMVIRDAQDMGLDLLILDCPPGFSTILREASVVSDLLLIPTGAGVLDLDAVTSTAEMAASARVPFRFVLNRAVFRSRLAGQAVSELRERGSLLLPPIHQRVSVAAAMALGRTALETEPCGAAAGELSALWLAVRAALDDVIAAKAAHRRGRGRRT
jgi:chromosome partitioning protein